MNRTRAWERAAGAGSGAAAGSVATVAMSGVMAAARAAGVLGEAPPRILAHRAASAAGGRPDSRGARDLLAVLAHLGFGAIGGAAYALVRRRIPSGPGPLAGAVWGLLVWAVSYRGWIPALGLLPPPSRDRRGRPTAMVVAHVVYGAALGALTDRWQPPAAGAAAPRGPRAG